MSPKEFKEWRYSHRLSVADAARMLRISAATINRFEKGMRVSKQSQYIISRCADYYAD